VTRIAALDPGRSKCGLVITDPSRSWIEEALVAAPETCREQLQHWQQQKALGEVLLGDGTGSPQWQQWLQQVRLPHQVVQEHGTTLAARERYWELEPARSWRRLIPQGMRLPPRDYDDVVAQILLERSLGRRLRRP
jgi:RNase H-fold protein (predicted Holliday junction resolvase)